MGEERGWHVMRGRGGSLKVSEQVTEPNGDWTWLACRGAFGGAKWKGAWGLALKRRDVGEPPET